LTRPPAAFKAYMEWSDQIKKKYGSIITFLLEKKLYWNQVSPMKFHVKSEIPFAERSDYRILANDWPYGLESGIKHVCIWLKAPLPVDSVKGALTEEGTKLVDDFVKKTFDRALGVEGLDRVLWYKNFTSIQSIRAIDHVHVYIRDVDWDKLDSILEKPPLDMT